MGATQLMLGGDEVWATDQQVRRQPWLQRRQHRVLVERRAGWECAGIGADQLGQCVVLAGARAFELGQQRLRLGQQGLHLGQVQPGGRADFLAALEDAVGLRARIHGAARDRHALVQFTQPQVAIGDLDDQRQFDRLTAGIGGQPLLQCRILQVAYAAPQVQFPTAQADFGAVFAADHGLPIVVEIARHPRARALHAQAQARELIGALDLECGPGFLGPERGDAQVAVVAQRRLDQALQQRIGEVVAPGRQILAPWRRCAHGGRIALRYRRDGRFILRRQAGAAGQQRQRGAGQDRPGPQRRRTALATCGDGWHIVHVMSPARSGPAPRTAACSPWRAPRSRAA